MPRSMLAVHGCGPPARAPPVRPCGRARHDVIEAVIVTTAIQHVSHARNRPAAGADTFTCIETAAGRGWLQVRPHVLAALRAIGCARAAGSAATVTGATGAVPPQDQGSCCPVTPAAQPSRPDVT